jgi:hypothetical protein
MSVIVAYTDGISTWIGSDTNSSRGDYSAVDVGPKWFEGGDRWWYGHVGSLRVANVISENIIHLTGPYYADDKFTPQRFAQRLIAVLEGAHIKPVCGPEEAVPRWFHGGILVRPGEIWDIDSTMALARYPVHRLVARGSGAEFALGADIAFATLIDKNSNVSNTFRLMVAIKAAQENHSGIRGQWIKGIHPSGAAADILTAPPVQGLDDFSKNLTGVA